MKETPILFTGEMVKAILDGRKDQTRRILNPQPTGTPLRWKDFSWFEGASMPDVASMCPYGHPGDQLWIRETWRTRREWDSFSPRSLPCADSVLSDVDIDFAATPQTLHGKWRPSIFMPRWASRITLEIVSVRVERMGGVPETARRQLSGWDVED
jgi:hypothetical protein